MTKYTHFTRDERVQLTGYLRAGLKQCEIAELLSKDPSSVSRELGRNSGKKRYTVWTAELKTKERRRTANQHHRKLDRDEWLTVEVTKYLKKYWSPEQIAGRLKRDCRKSLISHETIYQWIYERHPELKKYLRQQKGKYRRRHGTSARIARRKAQETKRSIEERPEIVERRWRLGDFEGDTIVGKNRKNHILTHVCRTSLYLLADLLLQASAANARRVIVERFRKLPSQRKQTITYDNGVQFAEHELIERETKLPVYFCHPYHSWERGTNENMNGLIRQFIPKSTSFQNITKNRLDKFVRLLNTRPRKCLNYRTPSLLEVAL
jgi:transposase, IS30 family